MDRETFINTDFENVDKRESANMILSMLDDIGGYYGSVKVALAILGIDWNAIREARRLLGTDSPRVPEGETTLKIVGTWIRLYLLKTDFDKKLCFIEELNDASYVCEPGVDAEPGQPIIHNGALGYYTRVKLGSDIYHAADFPNAYDQNGEPIGAMGLDGNRPPGHIVIGRLAPLENKE